MPLAPSVRREPVPIRRTTSATTSHRSAPTRTASSTPSTPTLVARATAMAPLKAPSDQPACRVETIERPSFVSMATPCAFIERSMVALT